MTSESVFSDEICHSIHGNTRMLVVVSLQCKIMMIDY